MLASELLALIPPAISAQSGIPMSKEITVPLPAGGSHEVSLSTIYQLCPELFAAEITPLNDSTVTLPARLGEIGSAGSGRARASLSGGLAAATSASAFSSEGFLPKGFSPAGATADKGAGGPEPEPGLSTAPFKTASGPTLNWGAGPDRAETPDSPAAPAAEGVAAEKNSFPLPSPISAEAGGVEKAAEEADGTGSEDSLFGASPFKGGNFATLFSKQAEADRDIPFPGGDLPDAPPPGFGEYFLSGGGAEFGEENEERAGEVSAPSADSDGGQGAPPEEATQNGGEYRAAPVASNQGASEEPPRGAPVEASPHSAPAPTETQGGDPTAPPTETAPSEGFSPSAGITLDWLSAETEEGKDSAAPLDAGGASRLDSAPTVAETPSNGPASEAAPEARVAPSGFDMGEMAEAVSEPVPAPAEPTVPSPPLEEAKVEEAQIAPTAAGFEAPTIEGFSPVREDAAVSLPQSPKLAASAAPSQEEGVQQVPQGFGAASCEESLGGRQEPRAAGNHRSPEAYTIAPSHAAAAAADSGLRDLEFRALFSSDETFTLAKVARRIVEMPGIKVCSLATPGRFVKASTSENESLGDKAKEMSEAIRNLAKLTGLPDARCFTLHSDQGTVSLFVEGDCCLTVNHDETAFGPGVRERLILIARSIHKLEG